MKLLIALSAAAVVVLSAVGLIGNGQSDTDSAAGLDLSHSQSDAPVVAQTDAASIDQPQLQVRNQPSSEQDDKRPTVVRVTFSLLDDVMGRASLQSVAARIQTPDPDPTARATEEATPDNSNARTADPTASPTTEPTPDATEEPSCEPAYPDVCIPPGQSSVSCDDVAAQGFAVLAPDPYGLDGDGDGVGCEAEPDPAPDPGPSGNGLLDAVNARRADIGLPALSVNGALQSAATSYCQVVGNYFASNGALSHDVGGSVGDRVRAAGFNGSSWGETLAWTPATPSGQVFAAVADSWWNSSGHHSLLYEARFSYAGAASCTVDGKGFYVIDLGS